MIQCHNLRTTFSYFLSILYVIVLRIFSIIPRVFTESFMIDLGSYDSSIFVWDIAGRKGTVYELHGHRNKVRF